MNMPKPDAPLKIGTRGSPLALAQAFETRSRLMAAFKLPQTAFEIIVIKTTGDNRTMIDADRPLKEIGNKGLFTKEIEEAMLSSQIDLAVHSTKDMPVEQPEGLVLDCFLEREDPRDAFVSLKYNSIGELPQGAVVGTSSLRRKAQLLIKRPDLKVVEFRGNVQTRLKKLRDGLVDATFLAVAGLNRLKMNDVPFQPVDVDDMLPAIAQGAIGLERRADDSRTAEMIASIHHSETGWQIITERAFLAALDGSCETPIGGLSQISDGVISLRGEILSHDGTRVRHIKGQAPLLDGPAMGARLGKELLEITGPDFL